MHSNNNFLHTCRLIWYCTIISYLFKTTLSATYGHWKTCQVIGVLVWVQIFFLFKNTAGSINSKLLNRCRCWINFSVFYVFLTFKYYNFCLHIFVIFKKKIKKLNLNLMTLKDTFHDLTKCK